MNKEEAHAAVKAIQEDVHRRCGHEGEFLQTVDEAVHSLTPLLDAASDGERKDYITALRVMVDPERVIMFRVPWEDDKGELHVNVGYRVQFSSALGPYKGGLRFHPTVNLSILKFLGFEQIFKNALTGLPMGGGKGGSDFNPRGRSDAEVRRFCQSFMTELSRHIGARTDVPAGDIGVGGREIGYLYGQYKRITNLTAGVLTGKGPLWGGSLLRPEATGYGVVYIALHALGDLTGKACVVSGSGNVAQYCVEKLIQVGARPLSMSDSNGALIKPAGYTAEDLAQVMELKNVRRGRISELASVIEGATYVEGSVWRAVGSAEGLTAVDVAFPCATQNEIDDETAKLLLANGCSALVEGANMPSTAAAVDVFREAGRVVVPAKAANAGGVAVSGLEMAQNYSMAHWTREVVDEKLHGIMESIYAQISEGARRIGRPADLVAGANVAAFLRVAGAMKEQGYV